MTEAHGLNETRPNYASAVFRLVVVALKLVCVYALSQQDAAFFYQQF